jgi:hypothetical protein
MLNKLIKHDEGRRKNKRYRWNPKGRVKLKRLLKNQLGLTQLCVLSYSRKRTVIIVAVFIFDLRFYFGLKHRQSSRM